MNFSIINGPNLNLLGRREPHIYGHQTFEEFFAVLQKRYPQHRLQYWQSNVEGELVNFIQQAGNEDGIILNAAAYSHTSIALADAVTVVNAGVVEVHISNVFAREDLRHHSFLSGKCRGSIIGLGLEGYALAIEYFLRQANR